MHKSVFLVGLAAENAEDGLVRETRGGHRRAECSEQTGSDRGGAV